MKTVLILYLVDTLDPGGKWKENKGRFIPPNHTILARGQFYSNSDSAVLSHLDPGHLVHMVFHGRNNHWIEQAEKYAENAQNEWLLFQSPLVP